MKAIVSQFLQWRTRFIHNKQGIAREVPHRSLCCTEAISCLPQIVTLRGCEEKDARSKGYKGSTLMQAAVGEKAHLGMK